ncbi:MAG: hypothetical protein ACTS22_04260 [Phycisphaerales bacterium]
MAGIDVLGLLILAGALAAGVAVLFGVSETIRDGERMHDLRIEVHRLHRIYLARLRGEDQVSIMEFDGSDVELVSPADETERPAARDAA